MPNYLAIDYGTKRIGIAHSIGTFAEPIEIIENNAYTFSNIEKLCQEFEIDQVVIGMSDREMADATKKFAQKLTGLLGLPIHFHDESYSSAQMHDKLLHSGKSQLKRRKPIDHLVAAEILQEFLDTRE